MNRPTSLQTSAPSKLPIFTSKELLSFLIHAMPLLKSSDFHECMIMSMLWSGMLMYCLVKLMESVRSFSVMEG